MLTRSFVVVAAVLAAAGCGGHGSGCPRGNTGAVYFDVVGLPPGDASRLVLRDDFGQDVVLTSAGVASVPTGHYVVVGQAAIALAPGGLVRDLYTGDVFPGELCVRTDRTSTVAAHYIHVNTSGALWTVRGEGSAFRLGGAALTQAGAVAPDPHVGKAQASTLAFDYEGNAWVSDATPGASSVSRFNSDDLFYGTVAAPANPDAVLDGFSSAGAIALDAATGSLWIADAGANTVSAFSPDGFSSASHVPFATLLPASSPRSLAFDGSGNLWVGTADRVTRYDAARLGAGDGNPPNLSITPATGGPPALDARGMAFDPGGNLWVSFGDPGILASFSAAAQASSGAITMAPSVQLVFDPATVDLHGIAFDEAGGLWTAFHFGTMARLSPLELALSAGDFGSSHVTPSRVVDATAAVGGTSAFMSLAFFPPPVFTHLPTRQ